MTTTTTTKCVVCGKALDFRLGTESCNDFTHTQERTRRDAAMTDADTIINVCPCGREYEGIECDDCSAG